eukprot:GHVT01079874.1.p1 GENE.GHVT01079874.1~~GHVT01079874.1.p1  ORF type:complete len:228 (+),score=31.85 GHVT01079874.1:729-1412(+)
MMEGFPYFGRVGNATFPTLAFARVIMTPPLYANEAFVVFKPRLSGIRWVLQDHPMAAIVILIVTLFLTVGCAMNVCCCTLYLHFLNEVIKPQQPGGAPGAASDATDDTQEENTQDEEDRTSSMHDEDHPASCRQRTNAAPHQGVRVEGEGVHTLHSCQGTIQVGGLSSCFSRRDSPAYNDCKCRRHRRWRLSTILEEDHSSCGAAGAMQPSCKDKEDDRATLENFEA